MTISTDLQRTGSPQPTGCCWDLFGDGTTPTALELVDTKTTSRGVVVHVYQASGRPECGSVLLKQE